MVRVTGGAGAVRSLKASLVRFAVLVGAAAIAVWLVLALFTARVLPDEWGVAQVRFGSKPGIRDRAYGAGLYFLLPGTTMRTFSREVHLLEASNDRELSLAAARAPEQRKAVERYFDRRDRLLGTGTHRVVEALNIQTSDGYSVAADVTLLYTIADPVAIARQFGWGTLYVDSFVLNTFRNGVLTTLGKMNAESFYDEKVRIAAVKEAEVLLRTRFGERGFHVEKLLLRNYSYAPNYEKSLHDKKVAVQLTEKNRKEKLVNEEKARRQQIESKGNAAITIAESEVKAQIAKVRAEAELYSSQRRAQADKEVNVAAAEAKRLKAEALTQSGSRYVVALEIAKMFDSVDGAVMTPEQYAAFIRSVWSIIGVSGTPAQGGRP